jgi:flagellar basal body-associated protein FliL
MAKKSSQDLREFGSAYAAGSVLAILLVCFFLAWIYFSSRHHPLKDEKEIAYARFGPMAVTSQSYSVRASFALQTSADDAGWAEKHRKELSLALEQVLSNQNPQHVLAQNGLQSLQLSLAATVNKALNTSKLQEILLTDFVLVRND